LVSLYSAILYSAYKSPSLNPQRPGRDADPSPLLVPWSRKRRDIPLLPLWAVRPVQSLSACTRVHFTFTCTSTPPMGRTACTEPQCLYKGALYLFYLSLNPSLIQMNTIHVLMSRVLRYILILIFHPHLFIQLKYLWNFQGGNLQDLETGGCCKLFALAVNVLCYILEESDLTKGICT